MIKIKFDTDRHGKYLPVFIEEGVLPYYNEKGLIEHLKTNFKFNPLFILVETISMKDKEELKEKVFNTYVQYYKDLVSLDNLISDIKRYLAKYLEEEEWNSFKIPKYLAKTWELFKEYSIAISWINEAKKILEWINLAEYSGKNTQKIINEEAEKHWVNLVRRYIDNEISVRDLANLIKKKKISKITKKPVTTHIPMTKKVKFLIVGENGLDYALTTKKEVELFAKYNKYTKHDFKDYPEEGIFPIVLLLLLFKTGDQKIYDEIKKIATNLKMTKEERREKIKELFMEAVKKYKDIGILNAYIPLTPIQVKELTREIEKLFEEASISPPAVKTEPAKERKLYCETFTIKTKDKTYKTINYQLCTTNPKLLAEIRRLHTTINGALAEFEGKIVYRSNKGYLSGEQLKKLGLSSVTELGDLKKLVAQIKPEAIDYDVIVKNLNTIKEELEKSGQDKETVNEIMTHLVNLIEIKKNISKELENLANKVSENVLVKAQELYKEAEKVKEKQDENWEKMKELMQKISEEAIINIDKKIGEMDVIDLEKAYSEEMQEIIKKYEKEISQLTLEQQQYMAELENIKNRFVSLAKDIEKQLKNMLVYKWKGGFLVFTIQNLFNDFIQNINSPEEFLKQFKEAINVLIFHTLVALYELWGITQIEIKTNENVLATVQLVSYLLPQSYNVPKIIYKLKEVLKVNEEDLKTLLEEIKKESPVIAGQLLEQVDTRGFILTEKLSFKIADIFKSIGKRIQSWVKKIVEKFTTIKNKLKKVEKNTEKIYTLFKELGEKQMKKPIVSESLKTMGVKLGGNVYLLVSSLGVSVTTLDREEDTFITPIFFNERVAWYPLNAHILKYAFGLYTTYLIERRRSAVWVSILYNPRLKGGILVWDGIDLSGFPVNSIVIDSEAMLYRFLNTFLFKRGIIHGIYSYNYYIHDEEELEKLKELLEEFRDKAIEGKENQQAVYEKYKLLNIM